VTALLKTLAALVLLAFTHGATAQSLSLREAVEEALARNPSVVAADAQQRVAEAREKEARAARLPRIGVSESATRSNNPVFVFGSLLEQGRFGLANFDPAFLNAPDALTNYRASITARVPLFDQFRTAASIEQSRHAVDGAGAEVEDARQRLRAEVIARFYGVLVAQERLAAANDAVRAAESDAKKARDRVEQGLLVESDALSAEVQVASFRQRVISADGDLAIARAALATLLQRPWDEAIAVSGSLPVANDEGPDLGAAVARAIARRAPVKIAALGTSDAASHLRAERGARLPRVDAFATAGASGQTPGRFNGDYTAGVVVTLDLFDRGRPARIAAARAGIDAARAGDASARDAVTMEVVTAWYRLRGARESTAVAAASVTGAEAAARIVRDRYEQGLTTITEQLRAQTTLVTARLDLLAARYDSLVAHAELLRTTGDLDDVQSFR
jgi:outer membrane protein TolC